MLLMSDMKDIRRFRANISGGASLVGGPKRQLATMLEVSEIPFDDPAAYALLSRGATIGTFQLESSGMQGLLKHVRPTSLNDISAVLSLYRPGPLDNGTHTEYAKRKNDPGRSTSPNIHRDIDRAIAPHLVETFGLIVYQEQVLAIIKEITGWDLGEAELIFDAMRKKKTDKMVAALPGFRKAAMARGYSGDSVSALWDVLVPFSDYSFNKAHSIAYAHISYWTAYLKANHPVEYMTSCLTTETDVKKFGEYLGETQRMGIPVLGPDINGSGLVFTATPEGIRYGLASIKGCGSAATTPILSGRPFKSIDDFFRRASAKVLNAGVLKSLIESGCLDSLWPDREGLLLEAPELSGLALEHRRESRGGRRGLIRGTYQPRGSSAPDHAQRKLWEKERLGIALSEPETFIWAERELSDAETTWIVRQLLARPGMGRVVFNGNLLPIGIASEDIEVVMARIGLKVN